MDYVQVSREGGVTKSCGTTATENIEQINNGKNIIFIYQSIHRMINDVCVNGCN